MVPVFPVRSFVMLEWLLPELTEDTCSLVLKNLAAGVILPREFQKKKEEEKQNVVGYLASGDLQLLEVGLAAHKVVA